MNIEGSRLDTPRVEEEKVKSIRNNPYFIRLCRGLEMYQKMINEENSSVDKSEIRSRMHGMYNSISIDDMALAGIGKKAVREATKNVEGPKNVGDIFDYALKKCESGEFSLDDLLNQISGDQKLLDSLFTLWNPKINEKKEGAYNYVNKLVAFKNEGEDDISLHILPAGSTDSADLIQNILVGFHEVAKMIKMGEIKSKQITMKSWMLGRGLESKVRPLLSSLGNLNFSEADPNDEEVEEIQKLALLYNGISLKNFLVNNEMPEVRSLQIDSNKFVSAFAS